MKKQLLPKSSRAAEQMPEGEDQSISSTDYFSRSNLSKPNLVAEQIQRVLELRSQDMSPGFTEYVLDKHGSPIPNVITLDSRKKYCSAVKILQLLMFPEILRKGNPQHFTEFKAREKALLQRFGYKEKSGKGKLKDGSIGWQYTGDFYLPQIGAIGMDHDPIHPASTKTIRSPGSHDAMVNRYHDEMVLLCDDIFEELSQILDLSNYLEGSSTGG